MEKSLTVSELNEYVRRSLAADPMLRSVRLRGEISNFKRHSAGHLYFSLKDEQARVACVMFRSAAQGLHVQPRDGMRVVLIGSAALYTATGQYQFYVDAIRDDGVGALHLEFEHLKEKLRAEGLFDASLKKPLPLLPRGVGIITSATGAVLRDIQQVALRRNPGVQLYLRPTLVQGDAAAADIVRAIGELDRMAAIDVIILGRGGGSLEELWPFNEEAVARAIFASATPIVSAVGHETDVSISDFVADVRAATPSVAAELVVPRAADLQAALGALRTRMLRAQAQGIAIYRHRLRTLDARLQAQRPTRRIAQRRAQLDALAGLMRARMDAVLSGRALRVAALRERLSSRAGILVDTRRMRTKAARDRLRALSPDQVLARGYAWVQDANGALLTDARQASIGEDIMVRLHRGGLRAEVTEVQHGGKEKRED